jgi:hypothetical protein
MTIKRLTVALDLTALDEKVLTYTQFLCKSLPIEKVYFIHVEQKLDLPASYLENTPNSTNPWMKICRHKCKPWSANICIWPMGFKPNLMCLKGIC